MSSRNGYFIPSVACTGSTSVIVVFLGGPIRLISVAADAFDAVALTAARHPHVHRRHVTPPSPLVVRFNCASTPGGYARRPGGEQGGGDRRKFAFASVAIRHAVRRITQKLLPDC